MTGKDLAVGFLKQLLPNGANEAERRYELSLVKEVAIGRDLTCQIILDSDEYGIVSRRHASIRYQRDKWEICDLDSANGTYINGIRCIGCRDIQSGDRILLGKNGPEFIFELLEQETLQFTPQATSPIPNSPLPVAPEPEKVTFTQLFPIVSAGPELSQKAFLVPGTVTVTFVVLMFATVGQPIYFNLLFAAYLSSAAYYVVYLLCGKHKPWWLLLGAALATMLILRSPILPAFLVIFRDFLPGSLPQPNESISFPALLVRMFFGAGLMEELLKAIPILVAYILGKIVPSGWRDRVGVWEPLDGILIGASSAVGFTLLETLGQYVPDAIQNATFQAGESAAQLMGLQLLIARILGSVAGHMAYSGYLGYFIGLGILKPRNFWQILGVGYFTASGLHALWNATGFFSGLGLAVVGTLSYAFLAAAILKARALSPTRSQNFATRFVSRP